MLTGKTLQSQPPWLVRIEAVAAVALIGWLDYVTGWEWSFFVFYALPIALVVRRMGRLEGFVCAALCTCIWFVANLGINPYRTNYGFALAGASRLFYFAVVVIAVAAVKELVETNTARIKALERAQELETEILRTSEDEKRRLGQDLHDGLGPHLAAMGYAATFLAYELREHDRPETAKAEEIRKLAEEATALARALARGIFPVQMDGSGLATALEDFATTTSRIARLPVLFFETGHARGVDPETAMQIFRIAQEAVHNAVKHGAATQITIGLDMAASSLRLTIADDGKGMAPMGNGGKGMGLHSMRYRARALGTELKIESKPNEGTIVSCEISGVRPTSQKPIA